jgi:hypothetical protein
MANIVKFIRGVNLPGKPAKPAILAINRRSTHWSARKILDKKIKAGERKGIS